VKVEAVESRLPFVLSWHLSKPLKSCTNPGTFQACYSISVLIIVSYSSLRFCSQIRAFALINPRPGQA